MPRLPDFVVRILLSACVLLLAGAAQAQGANAPQAAEAPPDAAAPKVVMYATDWCPYCAKARAYFREKRIDYIEHDVEKSETARAEHRQLGGRGVPLILVGEQRMSGFSAARFEALYASSRR